VRKAAQHRVIFQAGREFDLAKLHRLKAARRIQFITEGEEVDRSHGFQNMNLRDQELFNFNHPAQRGNGFCGMIFFHQSDSPVDLVQDLLEPELISLMHRDKK
jgi:hypothetical protein